MKRDKIINLRVTAEEKAAIAANAGSIGTAAYLRQLGLNGSVPVGGAALAPVLDADPAVEQDWVAPASTWKGRVKQLVGQGLPQAAAERVADQELKGSRG